jgi:hypothetical protein
MIHDKNSDSSLYSEVSDVNLVFASEVKKNRKCGFFSRGSEKHYFSISAHALKWVFSVEGKTERVATKTVKMRNWKKLIYRFDGAKIVLNPKTCEIWLKARSYKSVEKMIYNAWNRVDIIARHFSEWARIGLKPLKSDKIADIQQAHLVIEEPRINADLVPLISNGAIPNRPQGVGMLTDESHPGKAEATGEKSVEGMQGAEWLFLQFKYDFMLLQKKSEDQARALEGFKEYNENIKLHLKVLQEMSATLKQIRKEGKR